MASVTLVEAASILTPSATQWRISPRSDGVIYYKGSDGVERSLAGTSTFGTGIATWLATPSSANLAAAMTDETGSGLLVFGTSPSFTTSVVSASTTLAVFNTVATTVNAFGAASVALNIGHASGTNTILGATTFSQALKYGGVTLSNAVTGTGNMVLSTAPTFTTSIILAAATATTFAIDASTTSSYSVIVFRENTVDKAYLQYPNSTFATTARRSYLEMYHIGATGGVSLSTNSVNRLDITAAGVATFSGGVVFSSAITYGGVALSNSVTGTGSMVLSTSPAITTSLTTPSTTFTLLNATATTVNAFGAATALNIGNAGGTTTALGNWSIGGTLGVTGALTSLAAGGAFITSASASTSQVYINIQNTSGRALIGVEGSAGGALLTGDTAYATIVTSLPDKPVQIGSNDALVATFASTAITLHKAATMSSTLGVTGALTLGGGTLLATSAGLTNGAAAQVATMTNGPSAGNPTKWVPVNDNGTTRYIPMW